MSGSRVCSWVERLGFRHGAETLAVVGGRAIRAFARGPVGAPVLLVVGGVHGTEPIGSEVALGFLERVLARAPPRDARIVIVPLLNPVGMARGTRANGRGVDLMRNAPPAPFGGTPLVGGHRISPRLPWYMGDGTMEVEARALCDLVEREAPAIALDCHSGYGVVDRLWHPYARTRVPFPDQPAVDALAKRVGHRYRVEPVARVYTIRGDLWDHLYDRRRFLPLTLEMGLTTTLFGTSHRHQWLCDTLLGCVVRR